jgi:hypothetical protein
MSAMKKRLMTRVEDKTQKSILLSTMANDRQSKRMVGPSCESEYTASSEWIKWFRNRYALPNTKVNGGSASADV